MTASTWGNLDRRTAMQGMATALGLLASPARGVFAGDRQPPRLRIAACDWSLGKSADITALDLAREIGLDGLQVSFGAPDVRHDLRRAEIQRQYREASQRTGVAIASLGMGVLNSVPLATDPRAEQWVGECIDTMVQIGQTVVLLAFFGEGDILDQPAKETTVIAALRRLAPRAERAGVTLGLESWLDADRHLKILDAVDSPAVRVYYDMANMNTRSYDVAADLLRLGKDNVCEIHCKENGSLLGQGQVDYPRIMRILDAWDWRGWLVIEGAIPKGMAIAEASRKNRAYLASLVR